jgi:hypothetical protein
MDKDRKHSNSECYTPLSKSNFLYYWRLTSNQFVLASSPLRLTTRDIFSPLKLRGNSPYVTFPLMRIWVYLLWICLAFLQVYVSHIQHVIINSCFCCSHLSQSPLESIHNRNWMERIYRKGEFHDIYLPTLHSTEFITAQTNNSESRVCERNEQETTWKERI